MSMIACPNCGEKISESARTCVFCGAEMQVEQSKVQTEESKEKSGDFGKTAGTGPRIVNAFNKSELVTMKLEAQRRAKEAEKKIKALEAQAKATEEAQRKAKEAEADNKTSEIQVQTKVAEQQLTEEAMPVQATVEKETTPAEAVPAQSPRKRKIDRIMDKTRAFVIKESEIYFKVYWILPVLLAVVAFFSVFIVGCVDASTQWIVNEGTRSEPFYVTYYGTMQLPSPILVVLIWGILGLVIAPVAYAVTKLLLAYPVLHIEYLKEIRENTSKKE